MWQEVEKNVPDVSMLRRLLFSVANLPKETPDYWKIVTDFSLGDMSIEPEKIRVLVENLQYFDSMAFMTDNKLLQELYEKSWNRHPKRPFGVILISDKTICTLCEGRLLLRSDRPSFLTLYTDQMGTVPATHFRKYCQNSHKGCSFSQHYGYYTVGEDSILHYDDNWKELPYFVSTNMTAFEVSFLHRYEAELLLGQITYKQKCDTYNYIHKYEQKKKGSSAISGASNEVTR